MKKLTLTQRKVIADLFVNSAVALLSIGVISQLLLMNDFSLLKIMTIIACLIIFIMLSYYSVIIVKK